MHEIVFVPLILFILFIAPLWLFLHYRERHRLREAGQRPAAVADAELARRAERMEQRIAALEALLDTESPDWRTRRER